MPKVEIDYTNTIIYKITCNDPSNNDVYVGHTTNFVQRKHSHKQSCNNEKSPNHNCKLYKIIRENGGWQNWTMEIVSFLNCYDHYEARKKEQEYFTSLNATLNSIEPMPKPKEKVIVDSKDKKKIENTQNETFLTDTQEFYCEKCDYKCCKKFCWEQHLSTSKHKNTIQSYIEVIDTYDCACGKKYKHHPSFYRHKKICKGSIDEPSQLEPKSIDTNLIMHLIKQNDEFKKIMIEQNNNLIEAYKTL